MVGEENQACATRFVEEERESFLAVYRNLLENSRLDERLPDLHVIPELLLSVNGDFPCEVYRLFRPDIAYASSNGIREVTAVLSDRLEFEPVRVQRGQLSLTVRPLSWYSVRFTVRGNIESWDRIYSWVKKWIDVDDEKASASIAGVIHRATPPEPTGDGWVFWIDFGSAESEALWSLIETLEAVGATEVSIDTPCLPNEPPI